MNRLVIAVFAAMVFSVPAMAQPPAREVREQDRRCRVEGDADHHRYSERYSDRRADGTRKAGKARACEPKAVTRPGDPNPYATRAGDPNPYATRAGDPNPWATRAGDPNPYATRAGAPRR